MAKYVTLCLLMLLCILVMNSRVHAHLPIELLYCPVFEYIGATHTPKLIKTDIIENGLYAEAYDVTNSGGVDIVVYSAQDGGIFNINGEPLHKDLPIFYEVHEGERREDHTIYIDTRGEGKCEDLVEYSFSLGSLGNEM